MTDALAAYLDDLGPWLREHAGGRLVALWVGGSVALDDVHPTSDLDVAIVIDGDIDGGQRRRLASVLLDRAQHVPARGLEAVVYSRGDLAEPGRGYQVNVNGGPGMDDHVGLPGDDPSFWFVVDLAILRSAGVPIVGPHPEGLIAPVPEQDVREALVRSIEWHRDAAEEPYRQVLNACRSWHHLVTGGWAAKSTAARWAADRLDGEAREAVRSAAARREDHEYPGPSSRAASLVVDHVLALLRPTIHRLAAFAEGPGGGNPAGVVITPSPLPEGDMQRIAAGVGYSETAFLVPTSPDRERWDVRYFAPRQEVPFCGHATVAAGVVLAGEIGPGTYVLQIAGGPVTVETAIDEDGRATATLTSVPPRVDAVDPGLLSRALAALRIEPSDLDAGFEPAVGDAGARHLILSLLDRETLGGLDYDYEDLLQVMEEADLTTVALMWRESATRWHARDPFPVGGVVEDPATGAAAAAFGAYLRSREHIDPPARFEILQGEDMGRPSVLHVEVPVGEGGIRVSGTAVPIDG